MEKFTKVILTVCENVKQPILSESLEKYLKAILTVLENDKQNSLSEWLPVWFSLMISVVAIIIVFAQRINEKFEERKARLKVANSIMVKDPQYLIEKSIDYYTDKYKEDLEISTKNMLTKNSWLFRGENLLLIKDVVIALDTQAQENYPKNIKKFVSAVRRLGKKCYFFGSGLLPYPSLTLVENALVCFGDAKLWNGRTYAVSSIDIDYGIKQKINLYIGGFFDFYNTCMGLSFELAFKRFSSKRKKTHPLPLRKRFDAFEYKNRYCTVGVVTLTVFSCRINGKREKNVLIHRRGSAVAESANTINVVPGGSLQPSSNSFNRNDIVRNIIREFGEELFSVPEYFEVNDPSVLNDDPFGSVIANNTYFLGVGINPQNAFLEVLSLLVLDLDQEDVKKVLTYDRASFKDSILKQLRPNFEGEIEVRSFSIEEMNNLRNSITATPALREIAGLIIEHYDCISKTIFGDKE